MVLPLLLKTTTVSNLIIKSKVNQSGFFFLRSKILVHPSFNFQLVPNKLLLPCLFSSLLKMYWVGYTKSFWKFIAFLIGHRSVHRSVHDEWTEWMYAGDLWLCGLNECGQLAMNMLDCILGCQQRACCRSPFWTFYLPLLVTERQANHTCCPASAPYRCPWSTCAWSPLQVFCQGQWNFSNSDLRCEVHKEMLFR